MQTEYEATFTDIDKDVLRKKLSSLGAELQKPEVLMKRKVFDMKYWEESDHKYIRVRDEGSRITMSFKQNPNTGDIHDQKETELVVDDFERACEFLLDIGAVEMAFQETKREIWELNGVEISIDEWPFLEPFVEIEAAAEEKVQEVSVQLGFDYSQAFFGATDELYARKYNISENRINTTPTIVFEMDNPFL